MGALARRFQRRGDLCHFGRGARLRSFVRLTRRHGLLGLVANCLERSESNMPPNLSPQYNAVRNLNSRKTAMALESVLLQNCSMEQSDPAEGAIVGDGGTPSAVNKEGCEPV